MSVHYRALLHEAELTLAARMAKTGPLTQLRRHSARSHRTCVRLEIALGGVRCTLIVLDDAFKSALCHSIAMCLL